MCFSMSCGYAQCLICMLKLTVDDPCSFCKNPNRCFVMVENVKTGSGVDFKNIYTYRVGVRDEAMYKNKLKKCTYDNDTIIPVIFHDVSRTRRLIFNH